MIEHLYETIAAHPFVLIAPLVALFLVAACSALLYDEHQAWLACEKELGVLSGSSKVDQAEIVLQKSNPAEVAAGRVAWIEEHPTRGGFTQAAWDAQMACYKAKLAAKKEAAPAK